MPKSVTLMVSEFSTLVRCIVFANDDDDDHEEDDDDDDDDRTL